MPADKMLKNLKPGDPWTMILPELPAIDFEDGRGPRPPEVGDTIGRWFHTAEPGRNFRITRVHPNALETVFVGFQQFEVRG